MRLAPYSLSLLAVVGGSAWAAPDKIDQFVQKEMARSHIPAAAVAVIQNGKVLKLAAYGTADLERKQPATTATAFQIGSAAKMFTGVVLTQLAGEGKIELDAVRQQAQDGSPDVSALAAVVEKAGGAPIDELIARRLAKPLAMGATRLDPSPSVDGAATPGRAVSYEWKDGSQQAYRYPYRGAYASIADMSKFMQAMQRETPLSTAQKEAMWTPAKLANGKSGGAIGWTVGSYRGEREVGNSGGPALADVAYYPARKLAVVVLTNQHKLAPTLAHAIASQYLPAASFINDPSIEDEAPDLNARLIVAVGDLAAGKGTPARFAGKARDALPQLNEGMPQQLGGLPPMTRLVLLADSSEHRTRIYRAVYGKDQSLRWNVSFDKDKRITDIEAVEE